MKDWKSILVDAIKAECSRQLEAGRARAPEVAEAVITGHRDVVDIGAVDLARDWIVKRARETLKSTLATADAARRLEFEGLDPHIVSLLPRCIALPDNDREQEFTYVPIEIATIDQLAIGIRYLELCIERDQARVDALQAYARWRKNGSGA